MDFSDGGYWHYGMKCADPAQGDWYGKTSWGKAGFDKIVPGESFEYADVFCDEEGNTTPGMPISYGVLTLEETDAGTRGLTRTCYETPEALAQLLEMGMKEGFTQTWDRLEEFLRKSGKP